MKKHIFISVFVLFAFLLSQHAKAYCAIYRETDAVNSSGDPIEGNNFRSTINQINREISSNSTANECQLPTNDPDYKAGFKDLIWFGTEYFVTNDSEAVSKIVLSDESLNIKPYRDLKIGNSSLAMLADDAGQFINSNYSKADYKNDYENVFPKIPLPESDVVIIDGRAANLKCSGVDDGDGGLKGYVYLSDMVVLTAAGETMNSGCWKNAGNAFVCDGTLKNEGEDLSQYSDPHGADYTKWCLSDTVTDSGNNPDDNNIICEERSKRWMDRDRDGYGNPDSKLFVCTKWVDQTTGEEVDSPYRMVLNMQIPDLFRMRFGDVVDNDSDCDDSNSSIHPNATELCDEVDNNCSGTVDENFSNLGDSCSEGLGECNAFGTFQCSDDGLGVQCDAVATTPEVESCNDLDDDCDGNVDEDNICTPGEDEKETLCEDVDDTGAPVDNDGDGDANCDDSDCSTIDVCQENNDDQCSETVDGAPNCYDANCWQELDCSVVVNVDQDGDGVTIADGDCNDESSDELANLTYPNAEETCDSIDNNCNDEIDENEICSTPDPSENDSGSNSGCGCYLGDQHPSMLQKISLTGIAFLFYASLVLVRIKTKQKDS